MEEFIDILQDYILLVKDGKIKFYNKALRDLLGDNLKELNDLNILELLTDKYKLDRHIIINDKNNKEIIFDPIINDIIIDGIELRLITLKELKSKSYNIGDLELILDNIPLIAWIKDINGKYVYANKRYADVLCIDKSEIIGKNDSYIWDINQSNIFKNEDRKIIEEKGYFVMPQQVNIGNKYIWHNVIKFVVLDEFEKVKFIMGFADNISDKITLNEKKSVLEHEIQMETLKNEFFTNILDEFEKVKFIMGFADNISDKITLNEKKSVLEHEIQMETLKNEFFTNISHEFKTPLFIMGFADNISDKITLNEKKSVLEHEIQMETLKNEFFTNISHEFKTPLNIIISASKLINTYIENRAKENLDDIILKKYTRSIEKNAFRLERLINNLIDITKIDSGDYKISINNYNIVSLVENIALAVVDYIRSEDISIIFDTNKEEKIVKCDKESIERIILNLLSNSIKHIHGEGNIVVNINAYEDYVDITVKDDGKCDKESIERIILNLLSNSIKHIHGEGNIVVNINAYEDYVDITVKDDGEGIPKEYIENVFNKFGQADKSLSRKHEGSGLGLFIVKSLVEMHGGLINIESEVGVGTEVTIRLYSNELENSKEVNAEVEELINKCGKEFSDIYCI